MHLLNFSYRDETFGLPVAEVSEVLENVPVTPLPRLPSAFDGIFQLRGRIVTLLNFTRAFFAEDSPADTQIMIFESPYQQFALRAPGILESALIETQTTDIPAAGDALAPVLSTILHDGNTIYHVLSSSKIFEHAKKLMPVENISSTPEEVQQ